MFTQTETQYSKNCKKFMKPHTHIEWFKTIEWIENKTKLLVGIVSENYDSDTDVDFIEYTKDQYAQLCGFTSREVAKEAVERYKALQEEAHFEKQMAMD